MFDRVNNTMGHDLAVSYADRRGVIYRDLLAGKYRADGLPELPAGTNSLAAQDVNDDGWLDLVAAGPAGPLVLLGREDRFMSSQATGPPSQSIALADFDNRGGKVGQQTLRLRQEVASDRRQRHRARGALDQLHA